MTKFIIHVGPHKTGTTYLQEAFAHLRPQLAARGIHYPSLWGGDSHYQLSDHLGKIPNLALEAQFAELRAGGHATVLLSAEALSGISLAAAGYLRRLIGPDAPVNVVFYTRPWADLLPSQWKQAIKGGETWTWPEFLCRRLVDPAESKSVIFAVNFGARLRVLAEVFGKDALRIIAYDQVRAAKRDLFGHFSETILGLPDLPPPKIPPANVSPDAEDIEVLRALAVLERARHNGPIPPRLVDAMVSRYVRHKAGFETPALRRAISAHAATLTIDETRGALLALHRDLFAEYGQYLLPPRLPDQFFRPRAADIAYVHPDYLLTTDVQRELLELHRQLCPWSAEPAGDAAPEAAAPPVQLVQFQAGGNSDAFVRAGWSVAERHGRWSKAPSCELLLPRPTAAGDYELTIQGRPFVMPGRIAAQRVAVTANGIACGETTLAVPGTVRVSLPWSAVGRGEALQLRFDLADAARPLDLVAGSRDGRLLGLLFEQVSLAGPLPAGAASGT